MTKTNEVVVKNEFKGLEKLEELNSFMEEELAGLDFTFDRIKIPSGGGVAFELPGDDGEDTRMEKEIKAVILHQHPAYAYYENKYVGGNNPPECGSFDGKIGIGNPGGNCANCPYNSFGSGEGGGKACKNRHMLYLLLPGEIFPLILSLPTGSLGMFKNFLKRQLSKGRKPSGIVTKITLKKATSTTGITFAQANFAFERVLTEEEKILIEAMQDKVKSYAANLTVSTMSVMEEGFVKSDASDVKPLV